MSKQTKLSLEATIAAALANRINISSDEMYELIAQTETAIGEAEASAAAEKVRALDPALSPDPAEALQATQLAEFAAARLKTLLPRLKEHLEDILDSERRARWDSDYHRAVIVRDQAAEKFARVPELLSELVEIFNAAAAADKVINAVNLNAPPGERRRLLSSELHARGVQSFSRDRPSLLQELRLVDFDNSAHQTWPPLQMPNLDLLAPHEPYNERFTGNWWKAPAEQAERQRQEEAQALAEEAEQTKQFWAPRA